MFVIVQLIARLAMVAIAAGTIVRVSDNIAGRKPYPPQESLNGVAQKKEISVG